MELTTLRYFSVLASRGHMTRAARELGVTQPALSAMLKKLEAELGAQLGHRTGKGVELTQAGQAFATHAAGVLRAADAATRAVREIIGLEAGSIRVGGGATATSYLLPPVVSQLRRAHPALRFYVREAGSREVAAAVLAGDLDLGIVTLPISLPDSDNLVRLSLVEDELLLIEPPVARPSGARQSPTAERSFRWKDLVDRGVVAFEARTAVRELIDRAAAAAGVPLQAVMELRSIESIKSMVAAGIGVGFVSRFALPPDGPFGQGATCRDGRLTRRLAIVRRRDIAPSPAVREFERALIASTGRPPSPPAARAPARPTP